MSQGLSMPGIALITGANKGIGLEVVRQLASRGWRVFLTGRSLASVRKAASPLGSSVVPVPLDITSRISIEAAFSVVTQTFLPLLRKSESGRIINVSSGAGQLSDMGTWAPAYSISKTALNGVTGQFAAALRDSNIAVNSVCPGWVKTDMGGDEAPLSVEQGADTIVWLATEAPQSMTGLFVRDRKPIPW
jgi:NAD(P)-dependent dehydrogenase (short-subunit alcohol dehydrogenase family)